MSHPWFNPLYRRVLTQAVCVGWLGFELIEGQSLWLLMAAGASGYAVWDFFLSGRYPMETGGDNGA